jgi:hypothetical protein
MHPRYNFHAISSLQLDLDKLRCEEPNGTPVRGHPSQHTFYLIK